MHDFDKWKDLLTQCGVAWEEFHGEGASYLIVLPQNNIKLTGAMHLDFSKQKKSLERISCFGE